VNCREISEFLRDFVAGDLDDDVRAEFERHVGGCSNCTAFLAQYELTISASRKACEDPQEVPRELVEAILKALGRQP
jgi:anti-sigma factor RsiW